MIDNLDMKEYLENFIDEGRELLSLLENSILKLEKDLSNKLVVNEIFRAAHSLKGMAGTMGFAHMTDLTHRMEDLLHEVREDKIKADLNLVNLLFVCHDNLVEMVENIIEYGEDKESDDFNNIIGKMVDIVSKIKNEKQISNLNQFSFDKEQESKVKKKIKSGEKLYSTTVFFEKDCMLKLARAYMILDNLSGISEILESIPSKQEIEAGESDKDYNSLMMLIITKKNKEDIVKKAGEVLEVEKVLVEELPNDIYSRDKVEIVSECNPEEGCSNTISELSADFKEDFIREINKSYSVMQDNVSKLQANNKDLKSLKLLFRGFHTIKGLAGILDIKSIEDIAEETEYMLDEIIKNKIENSDILINIILNSADIINIISDNPSVENERDYQIMIQNQIKNIKARNIILNEGDYNEESDIKEEKKVDKNYNDMTEKLAIPKIGEILIQKGAMSLYDLKGLVNKQKNNFPDMKIGELAVQENIVEPKEVVEALKIQKTKATEQGGGFLRIPAGKIDNLVDMVGELIIIQSQVESEAVKMELNNSAYMTKLLRMLRISREIQGLSMSLRMVSLHATFQKLTRVFRDTCGELGKNIELETFGEETEIDRDIADRIFEPLMHMVRNSISHGIENSEEEREAAGKVKSGTICIGAYNKRGHVYIEIEDDGKGIDVERVYAKALEKKIIDPKITYTNDEIVNFIFLPGFSTAEKVSNISGRGVGMDVVKTEITKIGGKVEVINTPGYGLKLVLKIPINLAAMNGTIVEIYGNRYIIPTLYIKEIFKPEEKNWISVAGNNVMIKIRNEIFPIISIDRIFGYDYREKDGIIIVLEIENKLMALPVKTIIGKSEVVLKSLGSEFNSLSFIAGASILGDGNVALILDVENLFKE